MKVYHGGIIEINHPDVNHSKNYLDFGIGFYVTSYPEQAERWSVRKSMRSGKGKPIVNVYNFNEDLSGYNVLKFRDPEDDEKWLDFVCNCRDGKNDYEKYDIIIGGVANDDVFKSVDMYHRGVWDKERTLKELRYFKKNNQIAFITQKAIDNLLSFESSYEAEIK